MDLSGPPRQFVTTRWSVVLAAGDHTSRGFEPALSTLCEAYWHPVYAFVRRSGFSVDDARDLTQAFFARILEKGVLNEAKPERGRFRSFLLASLRNFLANQYDWQHALKRGGHAPHLSLEFEAEEQRYRIEPRDTLTPEHIYERRWASSILDNAMRRLAAHHNDTARREYFERLRPLLTDAAVVPSKALAEEMGMSAGALRVALHRLRRQFVAVLRETIAETVERDADVDDELRHLLEVISRSA
jgi:RNA polymerase sigma-70 factor (ECF subfamily)